jgi:hypothetical protein
MISKLIFCSNVVMACSTKLYEPVSLLYCYGVIYRRALDLTSR